MSDSGSKPDALASARTQIDGIDRQLVRLISERAGIAAEVARIKAGAGDASGDYYRPAREAEVLRRVAEDNPGPLDDDTLARLIREVVSACLALESPLNVAYLAPAGTYTQAAVYTHPGYAVTALPMATIAAILRNV